MTSTKSISQRSGILKPPAALVRTDSGMGVSQRKHRSSYRALASGLGAVGGIALLFLLNFAGDQLAEETSRQTAGALDDALVQAGLWPLAWAQIAISPIFVVAGALTGYRVGVALFPRPCPEPSCARCDGTETCWCRRFGKLGTFDHAVTTHRCSDNVRPMPRTMRA